MSKKDIHILSASRLLFAVGYFMLLPTLAIILLVPPFSLTPTQAGIALMVYAIGDRGLSLLCLPIATRIGHRHLQSYGYLLSGVACLSILLMHAYWYLLVAFLAMGIGLSLAGTGARSYLGAVTDDALRLHGFSQLYIGLNAGSTLGTILVFSLPFRVHSYLVFLFAGMIFCCTAILTQALENTHEQPTALPLALVCKTLTTDPAFRSALRNGAAYITLSSLAYFFYIQLYELVPVFFERTVGPWRWFGWVFAANSLIIVLLQNPIVAMFKHKAARGHLQIIAGGFILMGVGAVSLATYWAPQITWVTMIFFTFGEIFTMPLIDYLISAGTAPAVHVYFYALSNTAMALGRAASVGLGLRYLEWATQSQASMKVWWACMAIGAIAIAMLLCFFAVRALSRNPMKLVPPSDGALFNRSNTGG